MDKAAVSIERIKAWKAARKKIHGNVKCDCGHPQKDHYNGGWCHSGTHPKAGGCGCTWFHPNVRYINRKNKEKGLITDSNNLFK